MDENDLEVDLEAGQRPEPMDESLDRRDESMEEDEEERNESMERSSDGDGGAFKPFVGFQPYLNVKQDEAEGGAGGGGGLPANSLEKLQQVTRSPDFPAFEFFDFQIYFYIQGWHSRAVFSFCPLLCTLVSSWE